MGEYATMKVWVKKEDVKDANVLKVLDLSNSGVPIPEIYDQLGLNFEFGSVTEFLYEGSTYINHFPFDLRKQEQVMKSCKFDIQKEWLACFAPGEFHVYDKGDFTLFTANTTVKDALTRLGNVKANQTSKEFQEVKALISFLKNHDEKGMLVLSSEMIYHSCFGEFPPNFVRNEVNKKVSELTKTLQVPHW